MPQQRELFEANKLAIDISADANAPRLWVRRIAIWESPGGEKIRDIELRPGMNIIWSPDGFDDETFDGVQTIGHGSGKTLFCRLLRYCLGEQRFADESQREAIAVTYPNGIVGAEVMVDGVCWAVVRPLGIRRRHIAIADGNLDDVAAGDGPATSIDALIDAIEQAIVTPGVAELARLPRGQKAWPIALAWLTRDQECRFNSIVDWRSPSSGSDVPLPASGSEVGPRREALRAFLMALTDEEQECRRSEEAIRASVANLDREASHLDWDHARRQKQLIEKLELSDQTLPDMPLLLDVFKNAARAKLANAAQLPDGDNVEIDRAESAWNEAEADARRADEERIGLEARLPVEEHVLRLLSSEVPGLSYTAQNAASPVCPICEVPIDRVLATKCGLSHKLPDQQACHDRLAAKQQEIDEQKQKIDGIKARLKELKPTLALAKQRSDIAEKRLRALEQVQTIRAKAWTTAERLKDDAESFGELSLEREETRKRLRGLKEKLNLERERLAAFRDKQGQTFGRISQKFSAIVRRLINDKASGYITLNGVGFDVVIDVDGDRRTAAIDSLKVLAFDLACLLLSIEGATRIPAFLIHDSPREADLGLSIYDRLFHCLQAIEDLTPAPAFQYILTTTTRPPDGYRCEPWLRQTLHGAPATERLMRKDL